MANKRWESERGHRVDRKKRPLLTSQDWVAIQLEKKIGWNEWQAMGKVEHWKCFGELVFLIPRRRPVRNSTEGIEEIKATNDIPNPPEALPECRDEATER